MKKTLTIIFCGYILVLSCLPCSDKEECQHKHDSQVTLSSADHSSHHSDTEHCSPFCMCSCCGHSCNLNQHKVELVLTKQTVTQKTYIYKEVFCTEVSFSIWQPPKLS